MRKVKIHIDSPDPSPEVVKKYKNYQKIEGRLTPFYTLKGIQRIMRRNRMVFFGLIVLGVLLLLYLLDEL